MNSQRDCSWNLRIVDILVTFTDQSRPIAYWEEKIARVNEVVVFVFYSPWHFYILDLEDTVRWNPVHYCQRGDLWRIFFSKKITTLVALVQYQAREPQFLSVWTLWLCSFESYLCRWICICHLVEVFVSFSSTLSLCKVQYHLPSLQ